MSSPMKEKLVRFAKSKKGTNVKFKGKKEYTKGHAKGKGECQDLVDLGLKTGGGRMGGAVITPRKGMLVAFENHKTKLELTIYATKGGAKKDKIWTQGATMTRPNHIAIVDDVLLGGKKVWVWEQNVTKDKKVVRQPVRNDQLYVAAKKPFQSKDSVSSVKKFLEMKLDYHATERARPGLKQVDWKLVKDWMDAGYGVFVQIELKTTGKVKFYDVVKDERPK
jgi:hypothetical protein